MSIGDLVDPVGPVPGPGALGRVEAEKRPT
jgi:hypothetical protein